MPVLAGIFAAPAAVVVALVYELLIERRAAKRKRLVAESEAIRKAIGRSMEENILGITKLVNALFGKPALALLSALHIQPSNPQYPIPNHIAMELLVFALAAVFFLWLRTRLSVERPGGTQQVMETAAAQSDVAGRGGPARK